VTHVTHVLLNPKSGYLSHRRMVNHLLGAGALRLCAHVPNRPSAAISEDSDTTHSPLAAVKTASKASGIPAPLCTSKRVSATVRRFIQNWLWLNTKKPEVSPATFAFSKKSTAKLLVLQPISILHLLRGLHWSSSEIKRRRKPRQQRQTMTSRRSRRYPARRSATDLTYRCSETIARSDGAHAGRRTPEKR
jgi:hypothetical protein